MGRTLASDFLFSPVGWPTVDRNFVLLTQVLQAAARDLDNLFTTPGGTSPPGRSTPPFVYTPTKFPLMDRHFTTISQYSLLLILDLENLFTTSGGATPPGQRLVAPVLFAPLTHEEPIDRNFTQVALCFAGLAHDLHQLFT